MGLVGFGQTGVWVIAKFNNDYKHSKYLAGSTLAQQSPKPKSLGTLLL